MAVTDNFESYSIAPLNGQGSWSGSTDFDVQSGVTNTGSRAVDITGNADTKFIEKAFSAEGSGSQIIFFRTTVGTRNGALLRIWTTTTTVATIQWHSSTDIRLVGIGTTTLDASPNTDQWYKAEIEWDQAQGANGQVRARLDDGTFTSWVDGAANFSTVNKSGFWSDVRSFGTHYWDDLSDGATPATVIKDLIGGGIIPFPR